MDLKLFPAERMNSDYPWPLWAIGWLASFKAVLWLAYEPAIPEAVLRWVGWKYLLGAPPLLICAVALWRRRRWAAWGLTVLAAVDLVVLAGRAREPAGVSGGLRGGGLLDSAVRRGAGLRRCPGRRPD